MYSSILRHSFELIIPYATLDNVQSANKLMQKLDFILIFSFSLFLLLHINSEDIIDICCIYN